MSKLQVAEDNGSIVVLKVKAVLMKATIETTLRSNTYASVVLVFAANFFVLLSPHSLILAALLVKTRTWVSS